MEESGFFFTIDFISYEFNTDTEEAEGSIYKHILPGKYNI